MSTSECIKLFFMYLWKVKNNSNFVSMSTTETYLVIWVCQSLLYYIIRTFYHVKALDLFVGTSNFLFIGNWKNIYCILTICQALCYTLGDAKMYKT